MKFLINLFIFFGVALTLGFGLSYAALENGALFGTYWVGPWLAWTDVGVPAPDPYTQAYISRTNALELARAEGIRFVANTDSGGEQLSLNCSYRIDGKMPESAFWTLTATDRDGRLVVPNTASLSLVSGRIVQFEDGGFTLRVGPTLAPGNWLQTEGEGEFELVLTLYDTTLFSGLGPASNALPAVSLEACL